jgi:nicotinamide-nucleotide amidase
LCLKLKNAGFSVIKATTVPDDQAAIALEIKDWSLRSDALIICGGLGPTFDDLSREAVSEALKRPLIYHPEIFKAIKARFSLYRLPIPAENKKQAYLIEGAQMIDNPRGSAPGQALEVPRKGENPQSLFLLPGPFAEMSPLFESVVLPRLRFLYGRNLFSEHLLLHLSGISESAADEKLSSVVGAFNGKAHFTILGLSAQVDFHALIQGKTAQEAQRKMRNLKAEILKKVGPFVFGEGEETLESALGRALLKAKKTLAVAESCTAGGLASRITSVPGSSDYFKGGVIAYSNEVKKDMLGVQPKTLSRFGAVSPECAVEMAEGVRQKMKSSVGISITGIAGPSGGSAKKPVGLVYVGLAGLTPKPFSRRLHLLGDRETVRKRAASCALHFSLQELLLGEK